MKVGRLESLVRVALKPQPQGYYVQLVLNGDNRAAELGELKYDPRTARNAGRRLVGGRLFLVGLREAPEEIERLAEDTAAEAMDPVRRGHRWA
ncbi:hypothetical protein [Streptomyces odonnellii]|uniref:hypothetical protein n=1 Tax=Streptomyces odonnellii TaxID=1417980 RepID=UPI001E2B0C1A|nr:hypothetical protein [Streptomyces odonnellii]